MKFSIKNFSIKCDQIPQESGEILHGKLHFLCSVWKILSKHFVKLTKKISKQKYVKYGEKIIKENSEKPMNKLALNFLSMVSKN